MILKDVAEQSKQFLEKKGVGSPRRVVEEMLASVLSMERIDLYLDYERPLNQEERQHCRSILSRLACGEPIQYILKQVRFYGCTLTLSPAVLIPRPETELLVDKVVGELRAVEPNRPIVWDLCSGSGCIGIAIKKALPNVQVILSDVSEEALAVARENARRNDVDVEIFKGDLFDACDQKVDLIVSNPPYISSDAYEGLHKSVKEYEPKLALLGGKDGLDFIRKISLGHHKRWRSRGKLWLEIGYDQGDRVQEIFDYKGTVEKDWSGHDRFFSLEID